MKTLRSYLVLSAVMILGSSLLSGCYTQLALNDDGPEAVVDTQAPVWIEPPPIVIIIEPPYYPPPVVGVSTPSVGMQQPIRDIGNQRSGSDRSERAGSSSNSRTTGSTRGGR